MSNAGMMDMGDFFAQMEAEMLIKAKAEQAAEDAAWEALGPEEQARRIEAMNSAWASMEDAPDLDEEEDEDDETEEDDA